MDDPTPDPAEPAGPPEEAPPLDDQVRDALVRAIRRLNLAQQEIFNVQEAATYARVTPEKILGWIDAGLLHLRTSGEHGKSGPAGIIIVRENLVAWVKAHSRAITAPAPESRRRARRAPKAIDMAPTLKRRYIK
jgi:hypothetical protein